MLAGWVWDHPSCYWLQLCTKVSVRLYLHHHFGPSKSIDKPKCSPLPHSASFGCSTRITNFEVKTTTTTTVWHVCTLSLDFRNSQRFHEAKHRDGYRMILPVVAHFGHYLLPRIRSIANNTIQTSNSVEVQTPSLPLGPAKLSSF